MANTFTVLHNKGLERSIAQLEIKCSNHKLGCSWTGKLGQYKEHLNMNPEPDTQLVGCKYVELECNYLCGGWYHRGAMAKHQNEKCPQRPFCCDYCREYNSVHANVVYRHWLVCKCYPMECPNHCSAYAIERQNMEEHLESECPLQSIKCEFLSAGCEELVNREDMADHLEEFHLQHTSMLATANQRLVEEIAEKNEQINQLIQESRTEVTKVKEESRERIDSLWVENALLKMEITKMRTEVAEMRKEFSDSLSAMKERQVEKDKMAERTKVALESEVAGLKADFEESRLSLFQQCYSIQSYVGVFPVEFLMTHFSQHLQEDMGEWQSPPFYSHLEGYRLCLVVNPRRKDDDNGPYISVHACIMYGKYDDRLKWPFQGEITVQLRNQLTDRHHATGVIKFTEMTPAHYSSRVNGKEERAKEGWGLKKFISHSELNYNSLKNRQYLKEDRLCFRVIRVQL